MNTFGDGYLSDRRATDRAVDVHVGKISSVAVGGSRVRQADFSEDIHPGEAPRQRKIADGKQTAGSEVTVGAVELIRWRECVATGTDVRASEVRVLELGSKPREWSKTD
jgi:hypothetical protein